MSATLRFLYGFPGESCLLDCPIPNLSIASSNKRSPDISRDTTRVNREIRAREVRVIDAEGEQLGIMTVRDALEIAQERELDLVEVAPGAQPPVCRLMDYGKYLYEKQKRERESRKAQKQIEIKEVRLRPKTGEHDIQVVLTKSRKFLQDGAKVRVRIRFRGREIVHRDVALELMQRVAKDLSAVSVIESEPGFEGRSMVMLLSPENGK
ncbi:MAG: translation initiation factor IF-3 [Caldilineaceae bacterium]|nr:translation initiation factor IF-3 [Caldilineaceae bacterium]